MKRLLIIALFLALSGCTTNGVYDSGKTWMLVGAVVVGGVAASGGGGSSGGEDCHYDNGNDNITVRTCH
jgi:hypothetical protein